MKRAEREGEAEEKRGLSGYNRPIPKVVTSRSSMPRLFCAGKDRKRGSKLDAARFIRFEDYVYALVARRCGELLHG